MSQTVAVRHTWEAGHRLPHLDGKCQSLHGHSWSVEVTVAGPIAPSTGVLVEFAALKKHLRSWVDTHLDHGLMLGVDDPLLELLAAHGKTYPFGAPTHGAYTAGLLWPTVENVATLLARVMIDHLCSTGEEQRGVRLARVDVQETAVNHATWRGQ
ncbi:6-carboxytetrahydropterin synthase [Nocardioides sp.]|uniref:6-pyruvoyl trahydropterin synthase family protein n=1 Tax=Nocardioides sp. TaxID=35761 RepID=UPI0010A41817|nr:6-carboxytetrahydropterin synthase [Nocardioides sp.]THJ08449.1 6-carboxytetrahydropterin synthase [Nocardioides sp.]